MNEDDPMEFLLPVAVGTTCGRCETNGLSDSCLPIWTSHRHATAAGCLNCHEARKPCDFRSSNWPIKLYPRLIPSRRGLARRDLNKARDPKNKTSPAKTSKRKARANSSDIDELDDDIVMIESSSPTKSLKTGSQSSIRESRSISGSSSDLLSLGSLAAGDYLSHRLDEIDHVVRSPNTSRPALQTALATVLTLRDDQTRQLEVTTKWVERMGNVFDDLEERIRAELEGDVRGTGRLQARETGSNNEGETRERETTSGAR